MRAATILWGDEQVPVLERNWPGRSQSYRHIWCLKLGERCHDAKVSSSQSNREWYVQSPEGPEGSVPAGVIAARELVREGASLAVCTDLWGGRAVFISPDLVCVAASRGGVWEILPKIKANKLWGTLEKIRAANGKRWAGLPDVVAIFPDDRIIMREMKVAGKDKLTDTQHAFARVARSLFPGCIQFGIIEWRCPVAESDLTNR